MLRTLRPAVKATRSQLSSAAPTVARCLHSRVELPYSIDAGLNPFLSPAALKTIAVDWQQGVLDRLNELVRGRLSLFARRTPVCSTLRRRRAKKRWWSAGEPYAGASVLETLKQTATDPSQTLAFNYASEALNNSFFLSTLTVSARFYLGSRTLSLFGPELPLGPTGDIP